MKRANPPTRTRRPRAASAAGSARRYTEFDTVLSGITAMFVDALPNETNALIHQALKQVTTFLGTDLGTLVIFRNSDQESELTHTWARPGLPARQESYSWENYPWTTARLQNRRMVVFETLAATPAAAKRDRANYAADGVRSMAAVPLVASGRVLGTVAFAAIKARHAWPPRVLQRLSLLAHVFASALARRSAALALDERIAFEALIADTSAACMRTPAKKLDALVDQALGRVARCLGAERVSLVALTNDGQDMEVTHRHTEAGLPPTPHGPLRAYFPWAFRLVAQQGQSLVFSSPEDLPEEAAQERITFSMHGNVLSHASVPLMIGGRVRWILALECIRKARGWPPELLLRMRLLGEVLATAIERRTADKALAHRERLLRESQRRRRDLAVRVILAQEEERRHLARDLHDAMTPELASLAMDLGQVSRGLPKAAVGGVTELERIESRLRKLSTLAHGLSRALHPAVLDDLGLAKAVESECAAFEARTGIHVITKVAPVPRKLPEGMAIGFFRILQEGLRNVEKHARATVVRVHLKAVRSSLLMSVNDNGVGFEPAEVSGVPALGLKHVAERAQMLGGGAKVHSRAGRGTTLEIKAPLA